MNDTLPPTAPVLTRRAVLKQGLAGILAVGAAPLFLPSRLFGATAPSNRLNVGIVGTGLIAAHHIGVLTQRDDCRVVALCDVHRTKAERAVERIKQEYGGKDAPALHARHEELVTRPDLDVVFVTTPDHWHVGVASAALQAGKDVYCEKPLTLCVAEGRYLVDLVRRTGRVLQTGSQQRSNPWFRRAAAAVRNGWIGDLKVIRTRLGHFPAAPALAEEAVPAGFDYDRWLGPTPWRPYNSRRVLGDYGGGWRVYWEYGGRKNGDWGAHHFDIIQWALGMDDSGPVEFIPAGFEQTKYATFRYANGLAVERVDDQRPMIEFVGTRGVIRVGRDSFFESTPGALATRNLRGAEQHLYESDDHHSDFFQCVRTRQRPITDVEIGHRTASVCHLSNIARWLERPVRWDPATETIPGDAVASRHLDRPRRAPYALV